MLVFITNKEYEALMKDQLVLESKGKEPVLVAAIVKKEK